MNKRQQQRIKDLNARMDDFTRVNGSDPESYEEETHAGFLGLHREAQRTSGFARQTKLTGNSEGGQAGPQEQSLKNRLEVLEKQIASISFRSSDPSINITGKFPHFIITTRRSRS